MSTAAEISPKKENKNSDRKGILKSTPVREPAPKMPKIEFDLTGDTGAAANEEKSDAAMGVPPGLPGTVLAQPPPLPPDFGGAAGSSGVGAGAGGSGLGGSGNGSGGKGNGGEEEKEGGKEQE